MISRNKDMYTIKFLEESSNKKAEASQEAPVKKDVKPESTNITNKLDNSKAIDSRFSNTILSAGKGNISNNGGSERQLKSQSNNSIWDSKVIDRLKGTKDNKEKTFEEKAQTQNLKNSLKQGRLDSMVDAVRSTDTRKSSGVKDMSEFAGPRKYQLPTNNLSIFDNNMNFGRVPDQTVGEKSVEEKATPKKADDSWKEIKGTTKNDNLISRLFDNLTNNE